MTVAIGLSTYAFLWRLSDRVPDPLTLPQVLEATAALGGEVLQVCDHAPVRALPRAALADLRAQAEEAGVALELGTRGVAPAHLLEHLEIATALGSTFVRSMLHVPDHRPTSAEAVGLLRQVVPAYAERGVVLGLETYEQVPTRDLVGVVEAVGSDHLGVVLDPGNCVAALELPRDVVEATAEHVVNLHVKDFAFSRAEGWVGFALSGTRLGEGLLDLPGMLERVQPDARGINQVLEHWLPWQGDAGSTCAMEDEWTRHGIETMRKTTRSAR